MPLHGVYTALVTPFIPDTNELNPNIDYEAFRNLLHFQLQEGIQGLVLAGTTGESPTLTQQEKAQLISISVSTARGQIPIIVGTGSYSTVQTITNAKQAEELGADMQLVVTPYYNKPTAEGIYRHFKALSENSSLPIILYNIQGRTARNIDTNTLKRIADLPNVIGVKEASGNIEQMTEVIDMIGRHRPDFSILSGDDALTLPLLALGGHGVISVVSNLIPGPLVQLVTKALNGDYAGARALHYQLLPLFKGAFIETNPIPIKEAMNLCGISAGGYRLPLCELLPENRERLISILQQMQLLQPQLSGV